MRPFIRVLLVVFSVILIASCSEEASQKNSDPNVTPTPPETPPVETEMLSLTTMDSEKGMQLKIKNDAFEKLFIIQSSYADQKSFGWASSNPTSTGLKSRVVSFKKDGDKILMMEYSSPFKPGDELVSDILFATFPVTGSDGDSTIFDFNAGMNSFFLAQDWYVSDFYGKVIEPEIAVEITNSFLSDSKKYESAISFIQNFTFQYNIYQFPVKVTYYIKEYKPNPNFIAVKNPGFKYLGYFETNPLTLKDFGDNYTNITKFDTTKPIKYYVSSSFPKEYQQAALDGILYWNKAFGKEVMQAEIAPEGITAPDFEHNIVQWHTNHNAGYAYADAQMDPLTGEILHAQVFIPSAFAVWYSSVSIPRNGRNELNIAGITPPAEPKETQDFNINISKNKISRLDITYVSDYLSDLYLHKDLIKSFTPDQISNATKDIITALVAHEVGHTLGLRHNFAGSTVSELSTDELKSAVKQYLTNSKLPENFVPPSNSIMEYIPLLDEILIGAYLRSSAKPLPHDEYTIQWGYFNSDNKPTFEGHSFCTDTHESVFEDCLVFDSGKHIFERRVFNAHSSLENIPRLMAESYLSAKININPLDRVPINEATPTSWQLISSTLFSFHDYVSMLMRDFKLVNIFINYPNLSDIDSDIVQEETIGWLNNEIKYSNSKFNIFSIIDPKYFKTVTQNYYNQFNKIVRSSEYANVKLLEGGETGFTPEEINYMLERAGKLFPLVEDNIANALTQILGFGSFKQVYTIEDIEKRIAKWCEYLLTSGKGMNFYYSFDTRREAAKLLKSKGPYMDWLIQYLPSIAEKLRNMLEEGLGATLEEIDIEKFPREDRAAILDEISIYYMIAVPKHDIEPVVAEDEGESSDTTAKPLH